MTPSAERALIERYAVEFSELDSYSLLASWQNAIIVLERSAMLMGLTEIGFANEETNIEFSILSAELQSRSDEQDLGIRFH